MSRRPLDAYYTPDWMVRALLANVPEIAGTVLEPCVGDGSIARVLLEATLAPTVITNDVDASLAADYHLDATRPELWASVARRGPVVDWVVTNPPFAPGVMVPILLHALSCARVGVVLLSRRSFLEPTRKRGPVLAGLEPDRALITERHSFTGNGQSDSVTTEWLVWSRSPLGGRPIVCLSGWKPRKVRTPRTTRPARRTRKEIPA